jgi:DNA-binding MarR family transcriptional regulator
VIGRAGPASRPGIAESDGPRPSDGAPDPPSSPGGDDPLVALSRSFKATMVAMRRLRGRETHRAEELSYAQYSLLFGLSESSELSSRELACAADLSPGTVTGMLDSLEAHGLVRRTRSERDKRVVLTGLTERGQQLVDARRAQFEPRWRAALSEFSPEELRAATAVLDRVGAMFAALDQEHP